MRLPEYSDIIDAAKLIDKYIHRTPILYSTQINHIAGAEIFFKCENFQKVGAFKFRGACNAVFSLSDEEAYKGVATHSSGNHAQALALAAKMRGIEATIVMPNNSPSVKKAAVAGYGADIVFCEPTLQAREDNLARIVQDKGCTFIHPYDNFKVIAGQGTAAKELIEEVKTLDIVMAPVGGGGLLAGTSLSTKHLLRHAQVIAAEPEGADDAYRSFKEKKLIPSVNPNTICDGLLTSVGTLNFDIIMSHVDDILTANDEEIKSAMHLIWERMKIIIEPSSAVPLATILKNKSRFAGKRIGIILTGGNVDLAKLPF